MIGLISILFILGLMVAFSILGKDVSIQALREIPAITHLRRTVDLIIEEGQPLHVSIGHGGIDHLRGAPGLAALAVIKQLLRSIGTSDNPAIVTSGEGTLAILSQEITHSDDRLADADADIKPPAAQLTGLTPYSFAAGSLPLTIDGEFPVNLMLGSFGSEVALLTEAAERSNSLTIGSSENLSAQAILSASAQEPLIGEELFAAGAYLQTSKFHLASLITQDILRWSLIILLLVGAMLKFFGAI